MVILLIIIRVFLLGNVAAALPSDPRPNHPNNIHGRESLSVFEGNRSALANTTVLSSTIRDWHPFINCNGRTYRQDLAVKSCRNAVNRIPHDRRNMLFGLRIGQKYNVALPARFISRECGAATSGPPHFWKAQDNRTVADGLCTIDIVLKDGIVLAAGSYAELNAAAAGLLDHCVIPSQVGGIAMDLGTVKFLPPRERCCC